MGDKNIIQLWMDNEKNLPFPVRRNTWNTSHYALITKVKVKKLPYGDVEGIYFFNGKQQNTNSEEISSAGCYQWDFAEIVGFSKPVFKGPQKNIKIYNKIDGFDFGKYFNKVSGTSKSTINEVFRENPSYIKWCIENVDHFCLLPEELDELNPNDPQVRIGGKFRKINYQKYEQLISQSKNESHKGVKSHKGETRGSSLCLAHDDQQGSSKDLTPI